jgi:hypothetical protein
VPIDHNLALLPAIGKRNRRTRHCYQLGAHKIQGDIVQLLLGKALTREAKLENRHTRGAEVENQRGLCAGRQLPQRGLGDSRHLGVGPIQARIRLQKDLDDNLSVDGGGLNPAIYQVGAVEGLQSGCFLPLLSRNRPLGVLHLARLQEQAFTQDEVDFLVQVANQVAIAVENALAYGQIAALKDRLTQEKLYLEDEIRSELHFADIVGHSTVLRRVLQQVEIVAPTDATVLISGETGTGPVARAGLAGPLTDLTPHGTPACPTPHDTLAAAERKHILAVLEETGLVLGGPHGAAVRLGLKRSTLQFRLRKLGIARPGM